MGARGPKSTASLAIVPPRSAVIPAFGAGETPEPPEHLSAEAGAWWRAVCGDFELEPHQLCLLQAACESWDRAQQARKEVTAHGLTFKAVNGDTKTNPCVAIERDARRLFTQILRELDLDGQPAPDRRPPRLSRNAG